MHAHKPTWTADNGDGTFTNPLFYEEFSDPDIIRVGTDFYMTGTTMHTMPGLPVLHSTDLVNWTLLGYALDTLDLGPEFRLEGGEIYGQGIWAPCIRYRNGTFYIFSNVNGQKTQIYTATDPRGPWTHSEAEFNYHDLTVFFDDDGRAYVVWGYRNLRIAELDETLHRVIPAPSATSPRPAASWAKARTSIRSTASTSSPAPGSWARCACPAPVPTASTAPGRSTPPSPSTRISASWRATRSRAPASPSRSPRPSNSCRPTPPPMAASTSTRAASSTRPRANGGPGR